MTETKKAENEVRPKREIEWFVMLFHLHLHVFGLYGIFIALMEARFATFLFAIFTGCVSLLGVTAGAHRLWAHRSYTANLPLRIFLMLCQTSAGVGPIYDWVLNHRLHHKHKGTDNDPFNHKRGFFYSHFLSHMYSNSNNYEELVKGIDMSDIENDRVVMFQKRVYWLLMPILTFLIPINAPIEYWGESVLNSVCVMGVLRYAVVLHTAWLVNSSLLIWGLQPENNFSFDTNWIFLVNLSYWPHYHYLLPWDYQTGEYGNYGSGLTTSFIRVCYALGWATELKTIDSNSVKKAIETCVHSGKPLIDCLNSEGEKYSELLKQNNIYETPDHF
ncbi:acyl-CoA Delta-9 desaturase [Anabrus simplex]|uniref:acyl-CoA Delta-9 desaturase n=1 Tax=Anabrus simplex TaxID=316456 RepID=UPI0034DD0376